LRAAIAVRDPQLIIGARFNLSMPYWGRGDYRRALGYVSENHEALAAGVLSDAVLAAVHPSTNHPAVASHAMAAWYLAELGEFSRARAFGQEAVRRGEALQRYGLTLALFHLGGAYLRQGEVPQAVATLERCRDLCETNDYRFYLPWASARLGAACLLAGRVADSVALLKRTVEIDAARTSQAEVSLWCGWLAEAYLATGQHSEANALAARALDLAVGHGERGNQGWTLRLQAELAARQASNDVVERAEALYRQGLALAEELEMRPLQAHCHLGLGELYGRGSRTREARAELGMALEMLRAMGMTFWVPQAEAALARLSSA
jgi:tetratricopeptide (TPR) repeat protein